jgi:hypothetical protein
VDLSWLRAAHSEDQVRLTDGTLLPVTSFAEAFGEGPLAPNTNPEAEAGEQILEIQNYFSGWNLSPSDVVAAYGQTTRRRFLELMNQYEQIGKTVLDEPFPKYFDKIGHLIPEKENKLLWDLFPEFGQSNPKSIAFRILALRILALKYRLDRLEEELKAAEQHPLDPRERKKAEGLKRDLETFTKVAGDIDVISILKEGGLLPPEEPGPAEPSELPAAPSSSGEIYTDEEMLKDIMKFSEKL